MPYVHVHGRLEGVYMEWVHGSGRVPIRRIHGMGTWQGATQTPSTSSRFPRTPQFTTPFKPPLDTARLTLRTSFTYFSREGHSSPPTFLGEEILYHLLFQGRTFSIYFSSGGHPSQHTFPWEDILDHHTTPAHISHLCSGRIHTAHPHVNTSVILSRPKHISIHTSYTPMFAPNTQPHKHPEDVFDDGLLHSFLDRHEVLCHRHTPIHNYIHTLYPYLQPHLEHILDDVFLHRHQTLGPHPRRSIHTSILALFTPPMHTWRTSLTIVFSTAFSTSIKSLASSFSNVVSAPPAWKKEGRVGGLRVGGAGWLDWMGVRTGGRYEETSLASSFSKRVSVPPSWKKGGTGMRRKGGMGGVNRDRCGWLVGVRV